MADILANPAFSTLSSPLGDSPFDKGLANRDKIVFDYYSRKIAPGNAKGAAWRDEVLTDVADTFPGMGGFASGGGPLS